MGKILEHRINRHLKKGMALAGEVSSHLGDTSKLVATCNAACTHMMKVIELAPKGDSRAKIASEAYAATGILRVRVIDAVTVHNCYAELMSYS